MKILSKLICILALATTAFAVDGWLNFSSPLPIKSAAPYGDGLLMATGGGVRYRTNTADDLYTTSNGLGDQSISAVVVSENEIFAVSDFGIISTMVNGYWQVLSRSYASNKVYVIPGMVCLSGSVLTIAFENRLSFFSLKTLTSIITVDRISDVSLTSESISAMKVRGDSLFVAVGQSLYVRKMDWENLESDVQLYNQDSWSVVKSASNKGYDIKDIAWKNGKLMTFPSEGMRIWDKDGETVVALDTFSVISSDAPLVTLRGHALEDSVLYEKKESVKIIKNDTIRHPYLQSKVCWVSLQPSGKAILAGPNDIFYYDGRKLSELIEYKKFAVGGAYELQVLPGGGVLAASKKGLFSRNFGNEWSEPKLALPSAIGNNTDALGQNMKTLSVIPDGTVFYHIWGQGYFMYSQWGESLETSFMATEGLCMDNILENPKTPYTVAVWTIPAPDNNGFLTTSGSNSGYSLIYVDLNGNISCANNIGSAMLGGPMVARIDKETGDWKVYVGTRKELTTDADGGLDVFTFPPPKQMGGELKKSKIQVKNYYGTPSTPLDMVYEPKTDYFWIVTASSLAYWNEEQDSLRTPLSTNGLTSASFTSIDVDSRGNLWVGTSTNGAYRLTPRVTNPDTLSVTHFTTWHGLLSDRVQDVAIDSLLGYVWFAHDNGVTRYTRNDLRSTEGNMTDAAREEVKVFPNPFRPNRHQYVLFNNISDDAVINIYNRGGRLVATLANERVVGGRAEWDGRMDNGNIVAPGVYQYIIRGKSKVKKGKLLVIH